MKLRLNCPTARALPKHITASVGQFPRVSSTREFLQPPESSQGPGFYSGLTIEGSVFARGSSECSLADVFELMAPAWEIEILALVLNQLNGPLTSDMASLRQPRMIGITQPQVSLTGEPASGDRDTVRNRTLPRRKRSIRALVFRCLLY
jgi:hypothetical protein